MLRSDSLLETDHNGSATKGPGFTRLAEAGSRARTTTSLLRVTLSQTGRTALQPAPDPLRHTETTFSPPEKTSSATSTRRTGFQRTGEDLERLEPESCPPDETSGGLDETSSPSNWISADPRSLRALQTGILPTRRDFESNRLDPSGLEETLTPIDWIRVDLISFRLH